MPFGWIASWARGGGRPDSGRRRTRLGGELLESRWVPAADQFLWAGSPTGDQLWSTPANWKYLFNNNWVQCQNDFPGKDQDPADRVLFATPAGVNANCTADKAVTVQNMEVDDSYTATLQLKEQLTVSGLLDFRGDATIQGWRPAQGPKGQLNIGGAGTFNWHNGTLADVTVEVQRATPTQAGKMELVNAVGRKGVKGATLSISGVLTWSAGSVYVLTPAANWPKSRIQVNAGGQFNITADGEQWGSSDPTMLDVVNSGTVDANLSAGQTATIVGDYTTRFKTLVQTGTLALAGPAKQQGGEIELVSNGTLKLTHGGRVYNVNGGAVLGSGTVDGNLVFNWVQGYGLPTLSPGPAAGGFGRIIITESFDIQSDGSVRIDIGPGNQDFVEVRVYAALNGTLTVSSPDTYKPPKGTQHVFMSAADGFRRGFWAVVVPTYWLPSERYYWKPGASPEFYWVIVDRQGDPP